MFGREKLKRELKAELRDELQVILSENLRRDLLDVVSAFFRTMFDSYEFKWLDTTNYTDEIGELAIRLGTKITKRARDEFDEEMRGYISKAISSATEYIHTERFIDDLIARIQRKQL